MINGMSILFVSIAFPPKFDSEGLQVAKYFKYFREECRGKVPIDVVTSAIPTLNMPVDESLQNADSGYRQKIEIKIPENKYLNFLLRKINPVWVDRPDSKHLFFRQWKKVVKRLEEKPTVIYSRSFPASSAVMAMRLKDYYKVPWVMHLSDPWTDSPVSNFRGSVKKINEYYERLCFEKADKICLTSYPTIDFYANKYPQYKSKFEFFPNVYDPEDIQAPVNRPKNKKLRFVYTGGISGTRSPEPFLKAIISLPEKAKLQMEFIFSGHVDRQNAIYFEQYKDDCIRYTGALSTYKEAVSLQQSADVLMLIDFPIEQPSLRVYFLSKLLDYMIARRYILATSGEGSVCRQVIEGKMGKCFDESETELIKKHLLFLHDKFISDPSFFQLDQIDQTFNAANCASKLYRLLNTSV